MPYSLKKVGSGYKICSPNRCFSKKPLSRTRALKQLAAIQINSLRGGAVEGGASYSDSDSDDKSTENALDKIDKKEVALEVLKIAYSMTPQEKNIFEKFYEHLKVHVE